MNLFISDKPVYIIPYGHFLSEDYDMVIDGNSIITSKYLVGRVLVQQASILNIERFLRILEVKKLKTLTEITFVVDNPDVANQVIKDSFKIIKAGGGVVEKEDKVLMIYRLKKWDLPKGKLKKKENPREGAKREVEEECNIKVEVREKICTTWHSFSRKGKKYLKKINWYRMICVNDKNMQPQLEEDIQEVKWMEKKEAAKLLKKSYKSIGSVFDCYSSSVQS
jgi:8-oxo-(d)GTP phosphatase